MKYRTPFCFSLIICLLAVTNSAIGQVIQSSPPILKQESKNVPWSLFAEDIEHFKNNGNKNVSFDSIKLNNVDVFDAVNKMADCVTPDVRLRPDSQMNTVTIVSANQEDLDKAKTLLKKLDENPSIEPQSQHMLSQGAAAPSTPELFAMLYELHYAPARSIVEIAKQMLQLPPGTKIILSEDQNSFSFIGTRSEHQKIQEIIKAFDVEPEKPSPLPSNIAYRVYAVEVPLEIPSEKFMQQQFMAVLKTTGENIILSTSQLESSFGRDIRITELNCIQQKMGEYQLDINGTVSSMETFKNLISKLEQTIGASVEIVNMRFNKLANTEPPQSSGFDNRFYDQIQEAIDYQPTGVVANTEGLNDIKDRRRPHVKDESLSSPHSSLRSIKKTLNGLLGNDLRVRGYWFGNSSLPGQCTATVGSWVLEINTWSPVQPDAADMNAGMGGMGGMMGGMGMGGMGMGMGGGMMGHPAPSNNPSKEKSEFTMEISLHEGEQTILSNNVNARVGRPVIIGYTRNTLAQYIPGALVVIPELDFTDVSN